MDAEYALGYLAVRVGGSQREQREGGGFSG
jgi:hypothetical protein